MEALFIGDGKNSAYIRINSQHSCIFRFFRPIKENLSVGSFRLTQYTSSFDFKSNSIGDGSAIY